MQTYTKILLGMLVGAVAGLAVGPNSPLVPKNGVKWGKKDVVRSVPAPDAPPYGADREKLDPVLTARTAVLLESGPNYFKIEMEEGVGYIEKDSPSVQPFFRFGQTLVNYTEWMGRLFLALIKMVVVPLVFFSLTVGVASLGDFKKLGRMGGRTLLFFTATTVLALTIGLGLANLIGPGRFVSEIDRERLSASNVEAAASVSARSLAQTDTFVDQLIGMIPTNPAAALTNGNMLQLIFFAMMFGVGLTMIKPERSQRVVQLMDDANEAMVMLVHVAMMVAPYGVAALLFKVVGTTGLSVLAALAVYGLVVLLGLACHIGIVYASAVTLGARISFLKFLNAIKPALLLAFGTSSSSATLPVTKESVEDGLNVSNRVSSFVLPLGATVNMDGTALYQGVAALFIAQVYGIDLSLGAQLTVVTTATLTSIGAAGVPGTGMINLATVLTAVGVPTEGLALILGIDRLLDMFRTATNVVGDSAATALIARLEGEDLRFLSPAEDAQSQERGFEGRLREPHSIQPRA